METKSAVNVVRESPEASVVAVSAKKRLFISFFSLLLFFSPSLNLHDAESSNGYSDFKELYAVPSEYGEVIFRYNEEKPNQLFIIGMSHRDTLTRKNGADTPVSQIEVYRIAEWLISKGGFELLLPEGFFEGADRSKEMQEVRPGLNVKMISVDNETLEKRLIVEDSNVNAEMLLMENHGVKSRQVEDAGLYNAVYEKIVQLEKHRNNVYESMYIRSSLDYLQERRTAAMLQKIPDVINDEFCEGNIRNKKAILTIGLRHIPEIVKYLSQNQIMISSPAFTSFEDYQSSLRLSEADYSVTVIIPRTLTTHDDLVRLTKLEVSE